jgi:hypothetical protein
MPWLSLLKFGVPTLITLFVASFGYSLVTNYNGLVSREWALTHDLQIAQGKLDSYKRMVDRRDAAVKASKCKTQITYWITHPDEIPKEFRPFDQLTPPNLREEASPTTTSDAFSDAYAKIKSWF